MTDIEIRSANLDDLEQLLAIEQHIIEVERPFDQQLKDKSITYCDLKELVLSDRAEVVVAEHDKKIIGSGYAKICQSKPYLKHSHHAYLGFMYVEPDFRGRGVNKLVLDSLKEWSKNHQIFHFNLEVYAGNESAIRAYEKAGFKRNLVEMTVSLD